MSNSRMKMPCTLSSLVLLILCIASMAFGRSVRNRAGNSSSRNPISDQYSWICPSVNCPSIPSTCQTIEYFVMELEHTTDSGQRVTIKCESCEYCLDAPFLLRTRRSIGHHRHRDCSVISCPDLPEDCADIRMTDVLIGNTKCKQCPACYDNTVFNRT